MTPLLLQQDLKPHGPRYSNSVANIRQPATIMNNDPKADQDADTSSEDFHRLAKAAGVSMRSALQRIHDRPDDAEGYITFEIKDFDRILRDTKEKFETKVCRPDQHGNQKHCNSSVVTDFCLAPPRLANALD